MQIARIARSRSAARSAIFRSNAQRRTQLTRLSERFLATTLRRRQDDDDEAKKARFKEKLLAEIEKQEKEETIKINSDFEQTENLTEPIVEAEIVENVNKIPPKLEVGQGHISESTKEQNDQLDENQSLEYGTGPPAHFPYAPVLAVNRAGVFPDFLKIVTVDDKELIRVIKSVVQNNSPYLMLATKKDDENMVDVVDYKEDVYPVGTLCQILELKEFVSNLKDVEQPLTSTIHTEDGKEVEQPPPENVRYQEVVKLQLLVHGVRRTGIHGYVDKDKPMLPRDTKTGELYPEDTPSFVSALREQGDDDRLLMAFIREFRVEQDNASSMSLDMKKALCQEIVTTIRDIVQMDPIHRDTIANMVKAGQRISEKPVYVADLGAALTNAETEDIYEVLATPSLRKRLELSLHLLKQELKRFRLQEKLRNDVDAKLKEGNRKYFLEQELKLIKKELGLEKDDKQDLVDKWMKRLEKLTVPKEIQETIDEEIKKFQHLEAQSSEFQTTRNYLDWLTQVPWGVYSTDDLDIKRARQILDDDHYSMKDVKDRILEFMAVTRLRGDAVGKIICLHGPPGTGKTSIAQSIAKTLRREYYRFSVGGMSDVSEIKGHRRTYVGSMPGKAIQALKKCKTQNPLILLDEIDKIGGRSHSGDPSSALLEMLDPEQNCSFLDHYMDVPVDLSKILFLCTANDLSTIPGPLKDRMEMIEVGGYIHGEKREIATRHLIPKSLKETGLETKNCSISQIVLDTLINAYCRESGVRNLKKHIEKIHRKAAFKLILENDQWDSENRPDSTVDVSKENLSDFVGKPVFTKERLYLEPPVGAVCGLAWTSMGGSTLYIETALREMDDHQPSDDKKKSASGNIIHTGMLEKVMQESITIAHTVARHFSKHNGLDDAHKYLNRAKIHLHAPEGAVKKDGPSAGVTITTALLSLAMNKSVRPDVAMTGEISLSGQVMPVGGIKEKVLASKRAGITTVILPHDNEKDWVELSDEVKDGVDIHFAKQYSDVFKIAFADLS